MATKSSVSTRSLTSEDAVKILKNLRVMRVRRGDVLVLTTSNLVSKEVMTQLHRAISAKFPKTACLVLGDGMKIGIVRREKRNGKARRSL